MVFKLKIWEILNYQSIDLGTTYSCVGIWRNNKVEIIPNDQGTRITPSYVAFIETETIIGDIAKDRATAYTETTVFDSKRLLGRTISDKEVKEDIKLWPFELLEKDGRLVYKIKLKNENRYYTPEEISSKVLAYLKKTAERYLGLRIEKAVITVPAYFNNSQRQSTINAAKIAGLEVVSIINEPTAAAIAYGFKTKQETERTILVFDLGGGTFDVSILKISGENYHVLSTSGNTHLGGNDFDIELTNYFIREFQNSTSLNISDNPRAISRLRAQAERVKRTLSSKSEASVDIDFFFKDQDFQSTISRSKLEELCKAKFSSTLVYLDKALADAAIEKDDIDEVVMVGGSSNIPKIQELVLKYFGNDKIKNTVDPIEAVAIGAAKFASSFRKSSSNSDQKLSLIDVTPLSLGIETKGEVMSVVVNRNTELPVTKTGNFTTTYDKQCAIDCIVYEGESTHSRSNHLLGKFTLTGIPLMRAREPKINVTFTIDTNGILNVRAYEQKSKNSMSIDIAYKVNHHPKRLKAKNSNTKSVGKPAKKGEIALIK